MQNIHWPYTEHTCRYNWFVFKIKAFWECIDLFKFLLNMYWYFSHASFNYFCTVQVPSTWFSGIWRNFSQACQKRMFSALTSDFRKACRTQWLMKDWSYTLPYSTPTNSYTLKLVDFKGWVWWFTLKTLFSECQQWLRLKFRQMALF